MISDKIGSVCVHTYRERRRRERNGKREKRIEREEEGRQRKQSDEIAIILQMIKHSPNLLSQVSFSRQFPRSEQLKNCFPILIQKHDYQWAPVSRSRKRGRHWPQNRHRLNVFSFSDNFYHGCANQLRGYKQNKIHICLYSFYIQ